MIRRRARVRALAGLALAAGCAAPIVPQRSLPGGSVHWAEGLARRAAVTWAPDATPCRVFGAGIGTDGWLPDQGGFWQVTFWSAERRPVLEVTVDSAGQVRTQELPDSPHRGRHLPADWIDSPHVWAAARPRARREPVHTFEAELAHDAEPEGHAGQVVWRIRFWMDDQTYETHAVTPQGTWLASH